MFGAAATSLKPTTFRHEQIQRFGPSLAGKPEIDLPKAPPKVAPEPQGPAREFLNNEKSLSSLIGTPIDKGLVRIQVSKSKFRLTVLYANKPVKQYPIVLGADPVNDKRRKGDKRTPEGDFKLRAVYPHPSWSRFLWIDYPTTDSWAKHNQAKALGEIPQSAAIGGEIGIHGVPTGQDLLIDQRVNWTAGCISLKTADINEIYEFVQVGTPVRVDH